MAYVYKHIRQDNGDVFYIGIGDSKNRYKQHNNRNTYWKNIVNKFGFTAEIVKDNLNWAQACELEKSLIKQYGRIDLNEGTLVNLTDGGDGKCGYNHSSKTKKKISKSLKGHIVSKETRKKISKKLTGFKHKEETKAKLSKLLIGNKRSLGYKHTAEAKKKQSKAHIGYKHTDEAKKKISDKAKGRVFTKEHRKKLSFAHKGQKPWNYGLTKYSEPRLKQGSKYPEYTEPFVKNCPACDKIMKYSNKYSLIYSIKNNRRCYKCANT